MDSLNLITSLNHDGNSHFIAQGSDGKEKQEKNAFATFATILQQHSSKDANCLGSHRQ